MKKPPSFFWYFLVSFLIMALALLILLSLGLPFHLPGGHAVKTIDQTLTERYGTDQWVLAKGFYGASFVDPANQGKPVYVEGEVRVGIRLRDLKISSQPKSLLILYPKPGLLAVDVKRAVYFSDDFDQKIYSDTLASAKYLVFTEAVKDNLLVKAEDNLKSELLALAQKNSAAVVINIQRIGEKEAAPE